MTKPGKIILLNGATSSGKSTIATLLQSKIDEPFWHYSIDHLRNSGVLPLERIRSGEFEWNALRAEFFDGFHHSLVAFVSAGNNLIVEHIVETEEWMSLLVKLLEPYDVFFVGIHCPLDELERRETLRGDRPAGGARKDCDSIHVHAQYDLELDSTAPSEQNVDLLLSSWDKQTSPSAFNRMAAK